VRLRVITSLKEKGISPIFVLLKDRHSVIAPIQDMKNHPPRRDVSSAWHAATLSRPIRLVNNWTYPLFSPGWKSTISGEDAISAAVRFDKHSLKDLTGRPARIQFRLVNTQLFGFRVK